MNKLRVIPTIKKVTGNTFAETLNKIYDFEWEIYGNDNTTLEFASILIIMAEDYDDLDEKFCLLNEARSLRTLIRECERLNA